MEHHKELKRLWNEGMTSYGTAEGKRQVASAVEKTGCTAKEVKVIITCKENHFDISIPA